MIDPQAGFWLLPTRRRLTGLKKFFDSAKATGMSTSGYVIVHTQEYSELCAEYDALLPEGWKIFCVNEDGGAAYKCQTAWEQLDAEYAPEWVGFLSDDYEVETPGWDTHLIGHLKGWNLITSNDGWQAPKRVCGAVVWSADLPRAVGFLAIPGTQHYYWDDAWEILAQATNCWQCDMSVMMRHDHASKAIRPIDSTTERLADLVKNDHLLFDEWRMHLRDASIEAVLDLMRSKGLPVEKIDLTGIRLLISTPNASGRYSRGYVKSLIKTILALTKYGAYVDWHDHAGSSDLPLARALLFASAYKTSFTHWLSIDDDMDYNFLDIVRMLKLNREFIAAAGPAKSDEPKFAMSCMDAFGRPIPPQGEPETGVLHATHVGGAFVLLNRTCMEKMVAGYPELEFLDNTGQSAWALYHPLIVNKRHVGEDFAFCERWRAIGGRVDVLTTVTLGHSGDKTWSGKLSDWMESKFMELAKKEAAE